MGAERSAGGFASFVRRRAVFVAGLAFVATALGGAAAALLPRVYVVETRIGIGSTGGLAGAEFQDRVRSVDERLASHDSFAEAVKESGLDAKFQRLTDGERREKTEALVGALRARTTIEASGAGNSGTEVTISYKSDDADLGVKLVGGLSEVCRKLAADPATGVQEKAVAASCEAEKTAKEALDRARGQHAAYRSENHEFLDGADVKLKATRDEKAQLHDTTIAGLEQQKKQLSEMLAQEQQFRVEKRREPDATRLAAFDAKIVEARERLRQLTVDEKKTDAHPEVAAERAILTQLDEDRTKLVSEAPLRESRVQSAHWLELQKAKFDVQSRLDGAYLQLRQLSAQEKDQEDLAKRTPDFVAKDKALEDVEAAAQRECDSRSQDRAAAEKSLAEMRGRGALSVRAAGPPVRPDRPSGPGALLLALAGLIVGAGAGTGIALALDAADRSFRHVEAVSAFLGVPTLGAVHVIRTPVEAAARRRAKRRKLASLAALAVVAGLVVAFALLGDAQALRDLVKSAMG